MKSSNKGSQIALFSDEHVRRDYLRSKQWVQQHIKIKLHITGYAVAYETAHPKRRDPDRKPLPGRDQGSLYNQQKHAISDAVEWIRQNSRFKPRIFVATTPGFVDHPEEGKLIQRLVHNLKNGYGMGEYVWVRELTGNGFPHWHFVADIDKFNPVDLSVYWSRLFNSGARNSIRCGTKPDKNGKRRFWVTSQRMSHYLTKYLGKAVGDSEKKSRKTFRTFAISQKAGEASKPLIFSSAVMENFNGTHQRTFFLDEEFIEEGLPQTINPHGYNWKWTGHGSTYVGFQKRKS